MASIILKTYFDDFAANISLTRLLDAGIEAYLEGEAGFLKKGGPLKLVIRDTDLDDACKILEESGEDLDFPICPICKSRSFEEVPSLNGGILSKVAALIRSALFGTESINYRCEKCGYIMSSK